MVCEGTLSSDEDDRAKRRDRRVIAAEELTDEEIALITKAEVPAAYAYLDEELRTDGSQAEAMMIFDRVLDEMTARVDAANAGLVGALGRMDAAKP
jgi:hypothetical protein